MLACIFPGQGIQQVGLMNAWLQDPVIMSHIQRGADYFDEPWVEWLSTGPQSILDDTFYTQPIVFTIGYAFYQKYIALSNRTPDMVAGHSLGEWTAMTVAGAWSFEMALELVRARATVMKEVTCPNTGMKVVLGLSSEQVVQLAQQAQLETGKVVESVNFNAPTQTVIAGEFDGLLYFEQLAKSQGRCRVMALPVSGPFHSRLMTPACALMSEAMSKVPLSLPDIPVVQNVAAQVFEDEVSIQHALVRQINSPVQWVKSIQLMQDMGVTEVVECSPKPILSRLVSHIAPCIRVRQIV